MKIGPTSRDREPDERELRAARYVDGEIRDPAERAACEAALADDPAFRRAVDELRTLRAALAGADPAGPDRGASPGFEQRVLARLRGLPDRRQLEVLDEAEATGARIVVWSRRVVAAAAIVLLSAAVVWAGAMRAAQGSDQLQADTDEVRRVLERIDAEIERAGVRPETAGAAASVESGADGGDAAPDDREDDGRHTRSR